MAIIISEEKELTNLINHFNKINNLMKNIKNEKDYIVVKGRFITYPSLSDLGIYTLTSSAKKQEINDTLSSLTGKVNNGAELFTFIKTYKKSITKFVIEKNFFSIHTDIDDIYYTSGKMTNSNSEFKAYKEFLSNEDFKNSKMEVEDEITEDMKTNIKSLQFPEFKLGETNLRITKNQFISLKSTAKINISINSYNDFNKLLCIQTEETNVASIIQYYLFIDL